MRRELSRKNCSQGNCPLIGIALPWCWAIIHNARHNDSMNDWNIQSRAHGCEACEKPFADKQPYHTVLFEEKQEFRRQDICAECWQAKFSDSAWLPGFISHWQGVYEAPPPVVDAIQKETAETILRKLIELNDPRYIPAGFILAVMLERKRVLKVKEQIIREGKRTIIYEQPKTGEVFTITDPALHLDQLEEVQRDVAALLEHGLNPPQTAEVSSANSAVPNELAAASDSPSPGGEGRGEGEPTTKSNTEHPVAN